jgi:hypothetical protein
LLDVYSILGRSLEVGYVPFRLAPRHSTFL